MDVKSIASALYEAEKGVYQIAPIVEDNPAITLGEAYAVQQAVVRRKLEDGERLIGMKIGLTGKAMQRLVGVEVPDYGHLTDRMLLLEGQPCPSGELLQPKVEGELAFCLRKDIAGPSAGIADVYDAVDYVVPAIEVVDSRIRDWKITLANTVADNGSSGRFVIGSRMTPIHQVDMRLTGMTLEKNGELAGSGTTAEVWGNPAAAVAWLANQLFQYGITLKAGSVVLSGALTAALPAKAGDCFTAAFHGLGSVGIRFS